MATKTAAKPQPIPYAKLVQLLGNPDVPEADLRPYFTMSRQSHYGTAPLLLLNESLIQPDDQQSKYYRSQGNLGLGFLNHVYQSRRRRRFERNIRNGDSRPVLLSEGDSWFQYPLWLEDVVDQLSTDFNIMCLSAAGDELSEMITDGDYWDYLEALHEEGVAVKALILSGGGNDIVGNNLVSLLNDFDPTGNAAMHLNEPEVSRKFDEITAGYRNIFTRVHTKFPDLPILLHGYDYAIPRPNQGLRLPPLDGWLGDPMRARNIPDGPLQADIIRILIDRINTLFSGFDENHPGGVPRVRFVDNRGTIGTSWHDELHPLDDGFARVADNFRNVLNTI